MGKRIVPEHKVIVPEMEINSCWECPFRRHNYGKGYRNDWASCTNSNIEDLEHVEYKDGFPVLCLLNKCDSVI